MTLSISPSRQQGGHDGRRSHHKKPEGKHHGTIHMLPLRLIHTSAASLHQPISLTLRAGLPTATQPDGMSETTTLPAPMVTLSPMVTPGRMVTPPPIQQLSPMATGRAHSMRVLRCVGSVEWQAVYMLTLGPTKQSSPMVTGASSSIVRLKLAKKRRPTCICLP